MLLLLFIFPVQYPATVHLNGLKIGFDSSHTVEDELEVLEIDVIRTLQR
jgi:hypothetical protein